MAHIEVMNPVAQSAQFRAEPAKRLDDLSGKTVALYWNMKPGGDMALARVGELLQERYPGLKVRSYIGSVGYAVRYAGNDVLDQMARECDAAVGTSAD